MLCDWKGGEDAALWKIDGDRAGILTVDFITPIVDDPYLWGQIAAANSLSDVFAMGGQPLIALNVVAFPLNCLPLDMLKALIDGGASKVIEAGAFLMGGHSVEDQEPKYGLCVFGEVPLNRIWRTTGARPGDHLILTKPLGSGIMATGVKAEMVEDPDWAKQAAYWMAKLNDLPRFLTQEQKGRIHACTDVTGFGLAGHGLDMASDRSVDIELDLEALPRIGGALELAQMGLLPAGAYRNRKLYGPDIDNLTEDPLMDFLFDPQTSGGLLMACEAGDVPALLQQARDCGYSEASPIGRFVAGSGRLIVK